MTEGGVLQFTCHHYELARKPLQFGVRQLALFCWGILVTWGELYSQLDIICRRWSHHPSYSLFSLNHNSLWKEFVEQSPPLVISACKLPSAWELFSPVSYYIATQGLLFSYGSYCYWMKKRKGDGLVPRVAFAAIVNCSKPSP